MSDTRLEPGQMVARLDWLSFTSREPLDTVRRSLDAVFNGDAGLSPMRHGVSGYHEGSRGLGGAMVCHTPGREDILVTLPGSALAALPLESAVALGVALRASVTRLDVAVDGAPFAPADAFSAWASGNARSKVNRATAENPVASHQWISSPTGDTFYLGSPASDRRSRCYTMPYEESRQYTDGSPVTRWEVQFRRDRAKQVWAHLLALAPAGDVEALYTAFSSLALGLISDHVAFVDVSVDANLSRCPLLPWWSEFIGSAERVSTWVARSLASTIEQVEHYLFVQAASSLATWFEHARLTRQRPMAALRDLLANGRERMTPRHRAILRQSVALCAS